MILRTGQLAWGRVDGKYNYVIRDSQKPVSVIASTILSALAFAAVFPVMILEARFVLIRAVSFTMTIVSAGLSYVRLSRIGNDYISHLSYVRLGGVG